MICWSPKAIALCLVRSRTKAHAVLQRFYHFSHPGLHVENYRLVILVIIKGSYHSQILLHSATDDPGFCLGELTHAEVAFCRELRQHSGEFSHADRAVTRVISIRM